MPRAPEPAYPYDRVTDLAWNVIAASQWTGEVDPEEGTINARGPCPRCGDRFPIALGAEVFAEITEGEPALDGLLKPTTRRTLCRFVCECGEDHNRPKEAKDSGCGASWNLFAVWNDSGTLTFIPGPLATEDDRWESLERRELSRSELERVRTAAGKWSTGLATLIGLVAAVSVIKGRDNITDLSIFRQRFIIVTLGISLVALTWGALLAMRAAYGRLERQRLDGTMRLQELRTREVLRALSDLRWARRSTLFGVLAVAIAVGVAWWEESPTPGKLSITTTTDPNDPYCGTLKRASATEVRLTLDGAGGAVTLPVSEIKEVSFRHRC